MGDTTSPLCGIELGEHEGGGGDDEEYQSFCLLSEVICWSTEFAIMKVHLFTTEDLSLNLPSPWQQTWNKGSEPWACQQMPVQSEGIFPSVYPHSFQ